jgi:hypothetical protein
MSVLRKTVRGLIFAALAIIAVPVVLYVFAFIVNWRDQPPNAEALEFAAFAPPPVPDSANAYVYVLGLGTLKGGDPAAVGAERAAWIRGLAANPDATAASDPHPETVDDWQRTEPIHTVGTACSDFRNAECAAALEASAAALPAALADQRWLIDRYVTLLGYRAWREITSGDPRFSVLNARPGYTRWLFYLDTWVRAADGDAAEVSGRLNADLLLWRMALAESDSLIGKEIAARRISEHFDWGNLILRRLPPERRADGVPAAWRRPLTDAERSMRRAFIGEWKYNSSAGRSLKSTGSPFPISTEVRNARSIYERLSSAVMLPLLQPQDSANRYAATLVKLDALLGVPYTDLKDAIGRAPELDARESGIIAFTYNVLGRAILEPPDAATWLADYATRVADLEGARRAALLAADLRGLGATAELANVMIPVAAVRDPYTGGPFGWGGNPPTLSFTGLERTTRARHAFLY